MDIDKFNNAKAVNKILVDTQSVGLFSDSDPVKVSIFDDKISNIQKQNDKLIAVDGIAIGLYKFSVEGMRSILSSISHKINLGNDDLSLYQALDNVLEDCNVNPVYADRCNWVDIDTPQDLILASKLRF